MFPLYRSVLEGSREGVARFHLVRVRSCPVCGVASIQFAHVGVTTVWGSVYCCRELNSKLNPTRKVTTELEVFTLRVQA